MAEICVVGAGASGIAAALALADAGARPLVVDAGLEPAPSGAGDSPLELLVGSRMEALAPLFGAPPVPAKLSAPWAAPIVADAPCLGPIDARDFQAVQSFAAGGLAGAWGAGLYRFTDADLAGYPVGAAELAPWFDRLTREIGIAGAGDELRDDFGPTEGLLPPVRLSPTFERALRLWRRKRGRLPVGLRLGRPRLAVLTEPRDGLPPFPYDGMEFFRPHPSIYGPRRTLDRLLGEGRIELRRGILVESFSEEARGVLLRGRRREDGEPVEIRAGTVLLAAGAINSARIALRSLDGGGERELRLLDNPALQLPFLVPRALGRGAPAGVFGLVQLNLVWDAPGYDARLQGSLMELTAPARADLFDALPFAARDNLALLRHLVPALVALQLFFPAGDDTAASLRLGDRGALRIVGRPNRVPTAPLRPLLRALRRLGLWSSERAVVRVAPGHAVHYAGTLPMRERPGPFECDPRGLLHGLRRVRVADSAGFPRLPAKNMSFTMMANAMRVAGAAVASLADLP